MSRISGSGRTGWVVAVPLLAPFAVIELGDMVAFEDGNTTEAEIESYGQTRDDELIDPERNFREAYGARAYNTIVSLRAKIADILERFGIAVLPAEEREWGFGESFKAISRGGVRSYERGVLVFLCAAVLCKLGTNRGATHGLTPSPELSRLPR